MKTELNYFYENLFIYYTKPKCPWCSMGKHLLELNGLKYEEFEIEDAEKRKEQILTFKQNYPQAKDHNTYPIIVYLKNETSDPKFIGGCTDLMEWLHANGYKTSKV